MCASAGDVTPAQARLALRILDSEFIRRLPNEEVAPLQTKAIAALIEALEKPKAPEPPADTATQ